MISLGIYQKIMVILRQAQDDRYCHSELVELSP